MTRISRRQIVRLAAGASFLAAGPARAASSPINESGFRTIGGIEQWISIQGQNAGNPAILYLHGGPGEALSPFLAQFSPWLPDFTVAYWDQRGAGKTFERNGASTPDMTLDRLIADTVELAALIRDRLSKKKLILVGQSFGSILGINVIKRHPDVFHAFVGTGVPVSIADTIEDRAAGLRRDAAAKGDQATVKALDDAQGLAQDKRLGALSVASQKWILSPPDVMFKDRVLGEYADAKATKSEVVQWRAGAAFSGSTLGRTVVDFNLRTLGLDMPIPFFVIQGREDRIAGFDSTKAYVESLHAPVKAFIPVDGGHYACFTHANAFVAALNKHVRPLAV